MKRCRAIPWWLACAGFVAAAVAAAAPPHVEVVYVAPEEFADVRNGYTQTDSARDFYLAELRRYIERQAAGRLAEGDLLRLTITDVQLAGDYQARRPASTNVRVVREVNPARIDLGFRLSRPDGAVVREGKRELRSTGYPVAPGLSAADPLRYEKALLDGWLRQDLPVSSPR
jgi:Protein of unknown function (DUF3016)